MPRAWLRGEPASPGGEHGGAPLHLAARGGPGGASHCWQRAPKPL